MRSRNLYFVALSLAATLTFAGCQKQDAATVVHQRALDRWELLINHQPVKAYDFLSPGYRSTHTLDQYVAFIASSRLRWKAAKVESQECDADVCTVRLSVHAEIPGQLVNAPRDIEHEAPVVEHWVASDGQWYFLPDAKLQSAPEQVPNLPMQLPQAAQGEHAAPGVPPAAAPVEPVANPANNGH